MNPEIEELNVFKLEMDDLVYLFYPELNIINIEYYDSKEDDDFFVTIYYEGAFHLEESSEKDLNKLNKILNIFIKYAGA